MNTTNPAQDIVPKSITIKDIELHTLKQRKLVVVKQFYVEFFVGDGQRSTGAAKESKNRTSWEMSLCFDGNDRSIFFVRVFQEYRTSKTKLVGSLTDTIGGVVEKLKDGVFMAPLRNVTPDGLDLAITFTLAADPCIPMGAEGRQATDAVTTRATDSLSSVVDAGTNVQYLENAWVVLLKRIRLFNEIAAENAQIHPYASLAWSVMSGAIQMPIAQKNRDDAISRLVGTMGDVLEFVEGPEPLKKIQENIKTVTLLIQQLAECGYFIVDYTRHRNFLVRIAKYAESDISRRIVDYENNLRELMAAFLEGVATRTGSTVLPTLQIVEAIHLNEMPYAIGARYMEEKGCLQGTRESLLDEICDVLNNAGDGAPQVFLLTGVAGSGKSAVAHSIARLYDVRNQLGSSYCFARSDTGTRNTKNLFSTIARDLADRDPQYRSALFGIVKNQTLPLSTSPSMQLEKFIIEPFQLLHLTNPLVVVIDALDESGDDEGRRLLLLAIREQLASGKLPTSLRFLITTRPECDIIAAFPDSPQIVRKEMSDIPQDLVDADIHKFIYASLHQHSELESHWPNQEWCRLLVRHSQRLFQWASVACNFINRSSSEGLDPCEVLLQVANSDGIYVLDDLYRGTLHRLFPQEHAKRRFRETMSIVLALQEPLPLPSLRMLFDGYPEIGYPEIGSIITVMGSLLDGVIDQQRPICPLQTSFRDFLLDETRSQVFHIHILPNISLVLGRKLLACMKNMLRFNICDLKDSRKHNTDIPDLPDRVSKAIPPHLSYACRYWMQHLQYVECTSDLLLEVTQLFKGFFPYWLEAISLLSLSSSLPSVISAIDTCCYAKRSF